MYIFEHGNTNLHIHVATVKPMANICAITIRRSSRVFVRTEAAEPAMNPTCYKAKLLKPSLDSNTNNCR